MTIRFDGRVAIVTGAGNGLGRAHALGLASRGAKVVVNDFGGARDGTGGSLTPAETVVEEIRKAGGTAMADGADVSNFEQVTAMVERATREWGSVDLLCANAGILRDKSFAKMEVADFAKVLDVHLTGTFYCCKAVWDGMRERNYGRIVVTTSSSGLFGNFGQANYGAAKAGMVGLMNVLAEEGRKNNIRVNTISPTAATRMTEELLPPQALALMRPGGDHAGGGISAQRGRADPHHHGRGRRLVRRDQDHRRPKASIWPQSDWTPDAIAAHFAEIGDMSTAKALQGAFEQTQKYVAQAAARAGIKLVAHGAISSGSGNGASVAPCPPCIGHCSVNDRGHAISFAYADDCRSGYTPPCLQLQNHVAVIGAGPAGLMAAEVLAQGGADVTVYDAMPSAGRKFLMAGRGGLNLTHSEPLPAFLARYREAMPHLAAADRSISAGRVARLERGAGAADLRRLQRPGFPKAFKASPLAAGVAAAAGSDGRAARAASPLDRLGRAGPSAVSNAGWTARRRSARDRAGARRRKLAAARLRWRVG